MAMAQDPVTENAMRLARAFRISHGISGWPELSEKALSTIGCLQPPGLRQPRLRGWVQTLLFLPLFIIYADRTRSCRAPLPPLSDLFDDLFPFLPSFLACVNLRYSCYNSGILLRQEILRYLLTT